MNTTRNSVFLAVQSRNPVRVNNVAASFTKQNFCTYWHNQLARRNDRCVDTKFCLNWIVIFPPPLLTSDVDDHFCIFSFCKIKNRAECEDTYNGQDECRNNCENDFCSWLAVTLRRNRLTLVAILKHDVAGKCQYKNTNYTSDWENNPLQVANFLCVRAFCLPCILWRIRGASGQEQQASDTGQSCTNASTR